MVLHAPESGDESPDRAFRYGDITADIAHVRIQKERLDHSRRSNTVNQSQQGDRADLAEDVREMLFQLFSKIRRKLQKELIGTVVFYGRSNIRGKAHFLH